MSPSLFDPRAALEQCVLGHLTRCLECTPNVLYLQRPVVVVVKYPSRVFAGRIKWEGECEGVCIVSDGFLAWKMLLFLFMNIMWIRWGPCAWNAPNQKAALHQRKRIRQTWVEKNKQTWLLPVSILVAWAGYSAHILTSKRKPLPHPRGQL